MVLGIPPPLSLPHQARDDTTAEGPEQTLRRTKRTQQLAAAYVHVPVYDGQQLTKTKSRPFHTHGVKREAW